MIELKNVSKTYKSKKGKNTKALVDVSINFDSKGMTFILGKSGSGKSTLLNIIGGLDKYDSGDMVVMGKSTKDFTQVDFDSYRNTYVGFVFQEYNILDDYDVYENVNIALQLQQKEDNNQIDDLLNKLELTELKHRKVNELSGGQKQRVAIARALIKNPKIILADEPTGNLDSSTGKQVMDLLKEISKEKLVIIVSHDKESANTYGDRIIEIKDGTIIGDIRNQKIVNKNESIYKPIRSKLPFKKSFRLGIGSLRHKKIKLCFTIILTVLSLLFLSLSDTLSSYNVNRAHSKLLKDRNEKFVQIEKYHWYSPDDFVNKDNLNLTGEDILNIQSRISKKNSLVYRVGSKYRYQNVYDVLHIYTKIDGYSYSYGSLDLEIIEDSTFEYLNNFEIIGKKPKSTDETIISNFIADLIIKNGITPYNEDEIYYPKDYQEILNSNKLFYFGENGKVKIVGIIKYDLDKYKSIQEKLEKSEDRSSNLTEDERKLYYGEYSANINNIYNKVFVMDNFIKEMDTNNTLPLSSNYFYQLTSKETSFWQEGMYVSPSLIPEKLEYYDGAKWISTNSLNKNEVVINVNQLQGFDQKDYRDKLSEYINKNLGKKQLELEKDFFIKYIKQIDVIGKMVTININDNFDGTKDKASYDLVVVGVVGLITNNDNYYYLSSELMSKYKTELFPVTGVLILEDSQNEYKKLMDEFPYNEEISLKSTYSYDVNDMVRIINILKRIAFYVALVMIIFTIILISNFMFSSISYRKKEIGILRGLGARKIDVIKIFLWEGISLATISFVLASIGLVIMTDLLNKVIMSGTDIILTPFIIGIRQFVIILLFVYIIMFISSVIPIMKNSKMKPIDAILNK